MKVAEHQMSLDVFHEFSARNDMPLDDVYENVEDGTRDTIVLKFPDKLLVLNVDPNDDTIQVGRPTLDVYDLKTLKCVSATAPWSGLIGKRLGWGWVAINQQGYQDGILIGFDDLAPSVLLLAAASSIRVYSLDEVTD